MSNTQPGGSGVNAAEGMDAKAVLVGVALASLGYFVLWPLTKMAALVLVLPVGSIVIAAAGGGLPDDLLRGLGTGSALLLVFGFTSIAAMRAHRHSPGLAERRGLVGAVLRHPWASVPPVLVAGVFAASIWDDKGAFAALAVAFLGWVLVTTTYLLLSSFVLIARGAWRLSRHSDFAAGVVIVCCAGLSAGAYTAEAEKNPLIDKGVAWVEGKLRRYAAQRDQTQLGPQDSPYGEVIAASLGEPPGPTAPPDLPQAFDTPRHSISRCLEDHAHLIDTGVRLISRRVGSDEARDLASQALLHACTQDRQPWEFEPYFSRVLSNAATRWRRNSARYCSADLDEEPACNLFGDPTERDPLRARALRRALCQVPASDAEIIRLAVFDGLSHAVIAQELGISEANSRKRLERALNRMREKIPQSCQ